MNEATIREVFSDENFVKGLFELETPEAVQMALRQKDIQLSTEDIMKIRDLLSKRLESGEELSDEELEGVAGGVVFECVVGGLFVGALIIGLIAGAGAVGGAYIVNSKTEGQW